MKTFEPGKIRSITEMLDSTLHVKAIRAENEALKKRIVELETQIEELREMLSARGEALGLGRDI